MKISVITPCYNSASSIKDTIDSVIYQKGNFEIEYIIVDGNSKDNTSEIVNSYISDLKTLTYDLQCNKVDIKFISEDDKGMYDALIKGFNIITGDIVAYINADDRYLPNSFSTVLDIFSKFNDVKWVTGSNLKYNEKGQIISSYVPFQYDKEMILKGIYGTTLPFIQQESTFWRRELLGHLDYEVLRDFKLAGDYYLWHCFAKSEQLFLIESFLAGFTVRPGQLSGQKDKYFNEFNKIVDKEGGKFTFKSKLYKYNKYLPGKLSRKFRKNYIKYDEKSNEWKLFK